LASLTKGC